MRSPRGTYVTVEADGTERRYRYADSRLEQHAQSGLYWHRTSLRVGGKGKRRVATITSGGKVTEYLAAPRRPRVAEEPSEVYVRVKSHRAADRLKYALRRELEWWFSWEKGGQYVLITADEVAQAVAIPSVTRARLGTDEELHRCWT
jgi:hypothetical protein